MRKLKPCLFMLAAIVVLHCSEAPIVEFPEPTNRVVLAELFTEDG